MLKFIIHSGRTCPEGPHHIQTSALVVRWRQPEGYHARPLTPPNGAECIDGSRSVYQTESAPKAPGSYFDTELDTELDLTGAGVGNLTHSCHAEAELF